MQAVSLYEGGIYLINGTETVSEAESGKAKALIGVEADGAAARKGVIAYSILEVRNTSDDMKYLKLRFDGVVGHDITLVGIVQVAKASDTEQFPISYVLANCHNALCAMDGIINEDDHMFGLSAAKKYSGTYVSLHIATIHQYTRGMIADCGRVILGSNSRTHYDTLGTTAVGEGGGELVKRPLRDTCDVAYPDIVAVYLGEAPRPGTGPQDIALAIIGAVFKDGCVRNGVMEFVGPDVASMIADYHNKVGVMATETTCLGSIWKADKDIKKYLAMHNKAGDYKGLSPVDMAHHDSYAYVDLSTAKPVIALPFHPSNTYEIDQLEADIAGILREIGTEAAGTSRGKMEFTPLDRVVNGRLLVQQAVVVGYAGGTYSNVVEAARTLKGRNCGCNEFPLTVHPSSQPVFVDLVKKGAMSDPMDVGVVIHIAFCGFCFGTGNTPCNNGLSIRHTTRNPLNREGSKPENGQMAAVVLMDARSIAAAAASGGILISAWETDCWGNVSGYESDDIFYKNRVYTGYDKDDTKKGLIYDPNTKDWPQTGSLADNTPLKVCSKIMDPVATTDELISSGGTSPYRSNPLELAEFTLSRGDPEYIGRTKEVDRPEKAGAKGGPERKLELESKFGIIFQLIDRIEGNGHVTMKDTEVGSMIYAVKLGDGSAREQVTSCQRVIGRLADICKKYATKCYHSNVINWDMIPFQVEADPEFKVGDYIYAPGIEVALDGDVERIKAYVLGNGEEDAPARVLDLYIANITTEERRTAKVGCLINYNRTRH